MNLKKHFFLFYLSTLFTFNLSAQVIIPGDDLLPFDLITDSSAIHLHSNVKLPHKDSFELINLLFQASYNSKYPRGYNDGAVWKGRGFTNELHLGLYGKKGHFSYSFAPVIFFSQNADFQLAPQLTGSPVKYRYSYGKIDWPQQFGSTAFVSGSLGQSGIYFNTGKFITSISTNNYTLGPSLYNPILLSPQAAGFPHLRIGSLPFNLKAFQYTLAKLELNYIGGLLKESKYFDSNPDNNLSYINGLFIAASPSFMKGLTVSFNKVLYKNTQYFHAADLFSTIVVTENGIIGDSIDTQNDKFDGLGSLTVEWKFPEIGFRAYGEFAKNDFTGTRRRTLQEPEHSRAFSMGFEKSTPLGGSGYSIYIGYEHTNLSINHTYLWRAEPSFYVHHINIHGYTNRGQLIGAGIGPGANSDLLTIKVVNDKNSFNVITQRIEFNKDYFVTSIKDSNKHDTEYSIGPQYLLRLQRCQFSFKALYSFNLSRYYRYYDKNTDTVNMSFSAGIKLMLNHD